MTFFCLFIFFYILYFSINPFPLYLGIYFGYKMMKRSSGLSWTWTRDLALIRGALYHWANSPGCANVCRGLQYIPVQKYSTLQTRLRPTPLYKSRGLLLSQPIKTKVRYNFLTLWLLLPLSFSIAKKLGYILVE